MSPPLSSFFLLAMLSLCACLAGRAQTGNGIFSLRPQSAATNAYDVVDAGPDHFTPLNGLCLLAEGNDVYASNGTAVGTLRLAAGGAYAAPVGATPDFNTINPHFQVLGTKAIFSMVGADLSRQIWAADGTPAGTVLLHSAPSTALANPNLPTERSSETQADNLVVAGGYVYWTEIGPSSTVGAASLDWWRTDGTVVGTQLLHHFDPAQTELAWPQLVVAQGLAILAFTAPTGSHVLWTSNGSVAGTLARATLPAPAGTGSAVHVVRAYSDGTRAYFYRKVTTPTPLSAEVYAFNLTTFAVTQIVSWLADEMRIPEGFFGYDGATRFYLPALIDDEVLAELPGQFWTTNGTAVGTTTGVLSSTILTLGDFFIYVRPIGPWLMVVARDIEVSGLRSLYFGKLSDDLFAMNPLFSVDAEVPPVPSVGPDGKVWLRIREQTFPSQLRLTGMDPANVMNVIHPPYHVDAATFGWVDTTLWMGANVDYRKSEAWTTDATSTSLNFVADLLPQSEPISDDYRILSAVSGSTTKYYLLADMGDGAATLLTTNGRRGDVRVITDATGRSLRGVSDMLSLADGRVEFFWNQELWRTDGTTAGTLRMGTQTFEPRTAGSFHQRHTSGTFFFTDTGNPDFPRLWLTPLTTTATPVAMAQLDEPPVVGVATAFIAEATAAYAVNGTSMWRNYNFTPFQPAIPPRSNRITGSSMVPECIEGVDPGCVEPLAFPWIGTHDGNNFVKMLPGLEYGYVGQLGSNSYWIGPIGQLFKSGGTSGSTTNLGNTTLVYTDVATQGVAVGSTLYFMMKGATSGFQLWKTNGTLAGTSLVKTLATTAAESPLLFGTATALYFTLVNPAAPTFPGQQLWQSDGTSVGTVQITRPMEVQGFLNVVSDHFYMVANNDFQSVPSALNAKASAGWAIAHGLTNSNTLASADPDKDGKTNLRELLEGTNPNSGAPNLTCPLLTGTTPASATVSIPALASKHGVSVWLETSNDLLSWTRTPTTPLVVPTNLKESDCLIFPFSGPRFYRFAALEP